MKLKKFIKELKNISKSVDNPENVEVEMADCVPVVKPIFKDGTVFITDTTPEAFEKGHLITTREK